MIETGIIGAVLAFNAALVLFQEGALRLRLRR
jgi:hypothetical protein